MLTKYALAAMLFFVAPLIPQTNDQKVPPKPEPWFVVPDEVKPVDPPVPPPTPRPVAPSKLDADTMYVVQFSQAAFVMPVDSTVLKVTGESGPIRIRGKFYGGNGKTETRLFTGTQIFIIERAGDGKATATFVKVGAKSVADVLQKEIQTGPVPPEPPGPDPKPPVPPTPDPNQPAPIPEPGFRVLIRYQDTDLINYTAGQRAAIQSSKEIRDYLESHCVAGPSANGWKEYRIYDDDVKDKMSGESTIWQNAMKRPAKSLPWLVISDGKTGYEGELPKDFDETMKLLKKYGG